MFVLKDIDHWETVTKCPKCKNNKLIQFYSNGDRFAIMGEIQKAGDAHHIWNLDDCFCSKQCGERFIYDSLTGETKHIP